MQSTQTLVILIVDVDVIVDTLRLVEREHTATLKQFLIEHVSKHHLSIVEQLLRFNTWREGEYPVEVSLEFFWMAIFSGILLRKYAQCSSKLSLENANDSETLFLAHRPHKLIHTQMNIKSEGNGSLPWETSIKTDTSVAVVEATISFREHFND